VVVTLILLALALISNFSFSKWISAILILSMVFYGYIIVKLYQYNKKLKTNAIKC
jgi:positive regulator of sigma E activity